MSEILIKRPDELSIAEGLREAWSDAAGNCRMRYWMGIWWAFEDEWKSLSNKAFEMAVLARLKGVKYQTTQRTEDGVEIVTKSVRVDYHVLTGVIKLLQALLSTEYAEVSTHIPLRNGLYNIASRKLEPNSVAIFVSSRIETGWVPGTECPRWREFVNKALGEDAEQINVLQEWFGYCLTTQTTYQKILSIIGPPRSGKGVITKTLEHMLGTQNCSAISLALLTSRFGLAGLPGKRLASVNDSRFEGTNAVLVERLLTLSSGDAISVEKKGRDVETAKLGVKLMIVSNEQLSLSDSSKALSNRFLLLRTPVSHIGSEDTTLEHVFRAEIEGVLVWALEGLHRLLERSAFVEPETSVVTRIEQQENASPLTDFLTHECIVDPAARIEHSVLYAAWKKWARARDIPAWASNKFARELNSALPQIKTVSGDTKIKVGITLKMCASTVSTGASTV